MKLFLLMYSKKRSFGVTKTTFYFLKAYNYKAFILIKLKEGNYY